MNLKQQTLISINDNVNVFLNRFGFYSIALSSIKMTTAAKEGKKSHIFLKNKKMKIKIAKTEHKAACVKCLPCRNKEKEGGGLPNLEPQSN